MRIHDELWDAIRDLVGPGWRERTTDQFWDASGAIQQSFSRAEVLRATTALGAELIRRSTSRGDATTLDTLVDWVHDSVQSWTPFARRDISMALRTMVMEEGAMAGVPFNAVVFIQLVAIAVLAEQTTAPADLVLEVITSLASAADPNIDREPLPDELWEAITQVVDPYAAYCVETWGPRIDHLMDKFDPTNLATALGPVVHDLIRDACGSSSPDNAMLEAVVVKVERTLDAWIAVNHRLVTDVVQGLINQPIRPMNLRNLVEVELLICVALLAYYVDWTEPIRRTKEVSLAGSAGI